MSDGCSGKPQFDSWFWLRDRLTDRLRSATPVMSEDTLLPFDLPSVARKKLSVGFDGGQLSSDAGVLVLRGVEKKLGLAARLAACIRDESYRRAPSSITLDIDDTCDTVHGHQQLSLFNAHYDERCFLPIHIYEAASGKPVAMILREGKTPSGKEVRTVLKHVIKRVRGH